jgi:protein phosphatase
VKVGQRYAETNPGRKRRRNEDSFVCDPPLFAVADGMGGAQAGEVASSLAASALKERGDGDGGDGERRVAELIQEANRRVHQRAMDDAAASGMGTTMTVALLHDDGTVTIGHVGDSRAYLLRDGALEQITDDHSLVAELVRRGELSPEEAEVHPQRSVITRALGTDPDVDADTFTVQAQAGDLFLLCSDGLTTMVDVETITKIVARNQDDLRAAARSLIKEANDRGGDDNITTVLFDVAEGDPDDDTVEAIRAEDEDTLHPEDTVAIGEGDGDTSIITVEEIRTALDAEAETETETETEEPHVPLWRWFASALLIVALAALALFLVFKGLAR